MLSWEAFACAEKIARAVRRSEEPWGGIRILVVGDFAQLPPITRGAAKQWCFFSEAWTRSGFETVVLREVKRTDDEAFLRVLEDVRWGRASSEVEEFLNARITNDEEVELDVPHIFPRRAQTDAFNKARLAGIPLPLVRYETQYEGDPR